MRDEYLITCVGFCGGSSGGKLGCRGCKGNSGCSAKMMINGCRGEMRIRGCKGCNAHNDCRDRMIRGGRAYRGSNANKGE